MLGDHRQGIDLVQPRPVLPFPDPRQPDIGDNGLHARIAGNGRDVVNLFDAEQVQGRVGRFAHGHDIFRIPDRL